MKKFTTGSTDQNAPWQQYGETWSCMFPEKGTEEYDRYIAAEHRYLNEITRKAEGVNVAPDPAKPWYQYGEYWSSMFPQKGTEEYERYKAAEHRSIEEMAARGKPFKWRPGETYYFNMSSAPPKDIWM